MNLSKPAQTIIVLSCFSLIFILLSVGSYTQESATWDEPQFLLSGYLGLKYNDHRVVPGHPPFVQMWAALPLLATPGITTRTEAIPRTLDDAWTFGNQYNFTHTTLYRLNDADLLLYRGRFMIVLLGVLLGILLFHWAQELYGFRAALVVLALYCVEPNLLAHTRLVTTDLGITCFVCGTVFFLWRTTHTVTAGNLIGLAVFFSLAQVSKFTALILVPVVLVLFAVHCCRQTPWIVGEKQLLTRGSKALLAIALILLLAVTSYVVIWVTYGFQYAPAPPPAQRFAVTTSALVSSHSLPVTVFQWIDQHRLLPNLYTQGFLLDLSITKTRSAFLAGHYSNVGWWYYFPFAILVKSPLTLLMMILAGLVLCAIRWRSFMVNGVFIVLPVAIYLGIAMTQRINIGLRHILPIYPFLIMLAGMAVAEIINRRTRIAYATLSALMLLWIGEFVRAYPHNLAFFNSLVGGPRNGYKYLVDSNLDWGQDAPALRSWLDKHNLNSRTAPVYLSYFGTADLSHHGIHVRRLPGNPDFDSPMELFPLAGGTYCISATTLQCVYSPFPGPWALPYEQFYQQTLANVRQFEQSQNRDQLLQAYGTDFWNRQFQQWIQLRFARLCSFLRQRKPDDEVGYSILIYQLTDQQVQDALFGPPSELTPTIQLKGYSQ